MVSFSRHKLTRPVLILLSVAALTGFGCRPQEEGAPQLDTSITLQVWGLWQDSEDMSPIIAAFQEDTGIDIEYKKIASVAQYEKKLLESLAQGRGPDIFVIHHTWVEGKRGLMSPAPSNIIDERALREEFVDVIADDLIRDSLIYALPVSVDTLALFYNKDLLSAAGIARPPRTWSEFQQIIERLTKVTRFGTIEQSGAALGTAANVNRATDVLQLLFLQSGLPILTPADSSASLATEEGERALTFYTDFANKSKKVYTWDLQQDNSIDAFAEGETAIMINYSYHIPTIQAKNPRARFSIAPMVQIADSKVVNFASYWPFAVSNQASSQEAAWQFIRHLSSAEFSSLLNQSQQTPPARRDTIEATLRDPIFGVFAEQALTAVSWPRIDIVAIDAIIATMIDNVVTGATTPSESLRRAEGQINQIQPVVEQPTAPSADSPPAGGLGTF